jgi:OFA family oxalate/formate antiporter-like MFS transporter
MDIDTIGPGEDFREAIQRAFDSCEVLLAVIGRNWATVRDKNGKLRLENETDLVRLEIVSALERRLRVIPVLVGGAEMPDPSVLPPGLQSLAFRNAWDLSDKRFHQDVQGLVDALMKGFARSAPPAAEQTSTTTADIDHQRHSNLAGAKETERAPERVRRSAEQTRLEEEERGQAVERARQGQGQNESADENRSKERREEARVRARLGERRAAKEGKAANTEAVAVLPGVSRWLRVLGGVLMNLALGSLYVWSVFVLPLEREFGWARADTSTVFTSAIVLFALSFIAAGRLQDKLGPFWISLTGGILVSLGFLLSAFTTSLTYMYVCFGVFVGLGSGFGYSTSIPVMAKWFPDKRGLAVGLAVGGYGGGSAIFGPLANLKLIPAYGVHTTFQILGVIFLVMTVIGAFLLKNPPAGYKPAGWTPTPAAKAAATTHEFSPGEVLRTPTFYFMWIAYALGCSAGLMVISQLVLFARSVGLASAAIATMASAGTAGGRILSGWMSDALGRLNVLRLMIAISMIAMPILLKVGGSVGPLYVMVFIVYWCYGTQLSVNASTAADFWGTRNAGINYGMLFTAWGVAAVIGPRIASALFDHYQGAEGYVFYWAAGLALVALFFEFAARPPAVPRK